MAHGGRRAPDGRAPVAPGVGETARRHDLEAPKTPGLGGPATGPTDLQQGDVQRLEAASAIPPKAMPGTGGDAQQGEVEVPDAIDFIGGRFGGGQTSNVQGQEPVDMSQWMPLLRQLARSPGTSGPLSTALVQQLSNFANTPASGRVRVVDENAIQEAVRQSIA